MAPKPILSEGEILVSSLDDKINRIEENKVELEDLSTEIKSMSKEMEGEDEKSILELEEKIGKVPTFLRKILVQPILTMSLKRLCKGFQVYVMLSLLPSNAKRI